MPKVTITDAKGLVQTTGGSTNIENVRHLRSGGGQDTVKYAVPAAALGTGNLTITVAQIKTGILEEDPEGAATWTLPTNALLRAGLDDPQTGDTLDFCVINNATSTADEPITMAAGSGGTGVGNLIVEAAMVAGEVNSGSALFRIRLTSATAYSFYRLA
jgi:hypothetical protein